MSSERLCNYIISGGLIIFYDTNLMKAGVGTRFRLDVSNGVSSERLCNCVSGDLDFISLQKTIF